MGRELRALSKDQGVPLFELFPAVMKSALSLLCLSLGWRGLVEHVDLVF
jgi:hypothetical protein